MTDEQPKETPARKRGSNDDIWSQLGVEVNRELLEDLIFLRDLRERTQARRNMTWMALIGAFASAVIGALSVLLSNFFAHTGKLP